MDELMALLDEHGESIHAFCVYLAKNRQDGEDLFQETFLRAMGIVSKIDRRLNPKSYLMSIAVNIWKNTAQKRARRGRIDSVVAIGSDEANVFADLRHHVEADAIAKIMNDTLLEIVNGLEDKYRLPILLYYAENMKISEISRLLRKPEGTVKRLLHEAKRKIKSEMEVRGYEG